MKQRWLGYRVVLIAISLTTAGALVWNAIAEGPLDYLNSWVVIGASAFSLVLYTAITFRVHTGPRSIPAAMTVSRAINKEAVEYFYKGSTPVNLGIAQALTFIDAIVYPKTVFERISEQASSFHRSLMIKHTYTLRLSKKPQDSDVSDYVIPLFLFPKTQLQDGLRVFAGDGKRVSTLSSNDVLAFAMGVIGSLIGAAGSGALANFRGQLEQELTALICDSSEPLESDIAAMRARLLGLGPDAGSMGILETATALALELVRYHPICVTVPASEVGERQWPSTFRYRMEYRTIPPLRVIGREPWWQRLADTLRLALNVRLNRLFIPIPNATRTNSFHLQVEGPIGSYLARQGTIPAEDQLDARLKMQPRRAQRRAHLYVQNLESRSEVLFATQFYERAPGSFAATTAAAWAAAVVIVMLALQEISAILAGSELGPTNLLPALLAVPIAVASWTRGEASGVTAHPSLLSRMLTFGTIILCLTAFSAALVPPELYDPTAFLWKLLASIALGIAMVSTFSWFLRLTFEHHFSRRGDEIK